MATFHDAVPRKRMATYGKAARRRIPEYSLISIAGRSNSQTPEVQSASEAPLYANPPLPSATPQKLKQVPPRARTASPASPPGASIFDVPLSDDEVTFPTPKPKKHSLKPLPQRTRTVSPVKADVFDVPLSDDEVSAPASKSKKHSLKPVTSHIPKTSITKDVAKIAIGDTERGKRLKISPPHEPTIKRLPINPKVRPPKSQATARAPKRATPPPANGITSTIVARPKFQAQRKPAKPQTPVKLSPQPEHGNSIPIQNTPSPQLSSVDMMDVDPQEKYISPKGAQMWKELLEPEDETDLEILPERNGGRGPSPVKGAAAQGRVAGKTLYKSAGVTKSPQEGPRNVPRKRLIDSLVEQANNEDTDDDSEEDDTKEIAGVQVASGHLPGNVSRSQSLAPEVPTPPAIALGSQGSQNAGPKFVYGRERTILAEKDFLQELALDMPPQASHEPGTRRNRRGSIPALPALASFHEADEEDEEGSGAAIRSIHELRQAGANNRFLDEIEDFIERIGSPDGAQVSMRRSGLLDLASKMKDKNFARQFRANGAEQRLFVHLGQETDVIAGFIMISLLMTILAEGNMPHIVPQLRRQGITRLLIRLLDNQSSIVVVSKDRKSNMSKIAQSLLAEYHAHLLQISAWEQLKPQVITPRTIALKCLEKMVRQTREAGDSGDIFSKELTTNLFAVLKTASDESSWDLPNGRQAIDFYLALSALESHSITARTTQDDSIWISDFLPIIADALQIALFRPVDGFGEIQLLILRLALNVTNNNPRGADVFARPALLATMGQVVIAKFKKIARFLREEEFCVVMDHLVLALGVMINFAEWSSAARECLQSLEGKSDDPLERMTQLFVDNQERMSEADSVEESQKNVAFGYLSVLLGYFALLPAISERIQKRHPRKTLKPLVSSIEEFIGHHKTVDDLISVDPDGHNPHSGLTERLESLVTRLSTLKGPGR